MSQNNPCFCIQTNTVQVNTPAPCPDTECCVKACNAVVACSDSVGPCEQEFSLDLSALNHITDGCSGSLTYALESSDSALLDVNITTSGLLTGKSPTSVNSVEKFYKIYYRIICETDCSSCVVLESVGVIQLGIRNLCKGVVCDTGSTCDYCTGQCNEPFDLAAESDGAFDLGV